jgi:uncharacterized membrane protein YfcA
MVAPRVDLLLFGIWCFAVAAAGGLVGLVLGNLRLPATLVVASSAAAGAGANLAISAIAAATAAIAHVRAGRVNWRLFAWMAPPSILGAVAGGYLGGKAPDGVLLGFISLVLFYSSYELFRWEPRAAAPADAPAAELDIRAAVVSGAAIGVLGGLVGLILGSLRMPALLRFVGETPHRAVGTNVTVGMCVGIAGALAHLPDAAPDLDVVLVGAAASIPGALLGSRLTGRLDERQLVRAVAYVLVVAGAACAVQAVGRA